MRSASPATVGPRRSRPSLSLLLAAAVLAGCVAPQEPGSEAASTGAASAAASPSRRQTSAARPAASSGSAERTPAASQPSTTPSSVVLPGAGRSAMPSPSTAARTATASATAQTAPRAATSPSAPTAGASPTAVPAAVSEPAATASSASPPVDSTRLTAAGTGEGTRESSPTVDRINALSANVATGSRAAMEELAGVATASPADANVRAAAVRAAQERLPDFLVELLFRKRAAGAEVDDLLREVGFAMGERARQTELVAAIREVAAQACCMSQASLAAVLEGMAAGLAIANAPVITSDEAVARLETLAADSDEPLASVAALALTHFADR